MAKLDGKLTVPVTIELELPEIPPPGNGDPGPAPAEPYFWYQDGADLSILLGGEGGQKLNSKLAAAQAWYRGGMFTGWIKLNPSSPEAGSALMIFPRGDHFEFRTPGLANAGNAAYGTGWYSNGSEADVMPVRVEWRDYGLEFSVPNPALSDRFSRIKKGFPTTWETYGLLLSWQIPVP